MPNIREPVEVRTTVKSLRVDEDGESLLTLRIPASEAATVARFAVMRGIVFKTVFTPEDVEEAAPSV